jgi:hypothetical protein
MIGSRFGATWLAAVVATLAACRGEPGWSGDIPDVSEASFRSTVYPVLMLDCAYSECHGVRQRFLLVYGPGRTRLDPATRTTDPPTAAELRVSYERAVSMLASESGDDIEQSRLLRKPLAIAAGGVGHLGVDTFGRNIFQDKLSPGYVALQRWAEGMPPLTADAGRAAAGGAP